MSGPFPTIFRAAAPGSAANAAGFWAGDQAGTFEGLKQAIHDGLSAGVAGYPIWGSDIGGYASADPPLTAEVFVRWAQFSAVSPIFEVGGIGRNATFWDFGARTVGLFRAAAVLHYELFPYLYGLARTAHATGLPVLRPLGARRPGRPACVGRGPGGARRARPARGAGDEPRDERKRLPAPGLLGRPRVGSGRSPAAARSCGRPRSPSCRSTCGRGARSRSRRGRRRSGRSAGRRTR